MTPDMGFVSTGAGNLEDGIFLMVFNDAHPMHRKCRICLPLRWCGAGIEMELSFDFNLAAS